MSMDKKKLYDTAENGDEKDKTKLLDDHVEVSEVIIIWFVWFVYVYRHFLIIIFWYKQPIMIYHIFISS